MSNSRRISSRLDGISDSVTLRLNAAVQAMKSQGEDVANLTAGEPDFAVPEVGKQAVIEAVRANRSKYTPVAGIPELREKIARKTNLQQKSLSEPWRAANVVVTNGGKQAIYNTMLALLEAGDEVLVPSPYWLSYPDMAKLAGGVPRIVDCPASERFLLTPSRLASALQSAPRAKLLLLNSPSNPTGAMYSREEFVALGEVLRRHPDVWVVSDEIYDRVILGQKPFSSFLDACPELANRTVTVNGLSKSGAMTGWRLGWAVAPQDAAQAISTVQGQSTSGVNALAQWAGLAVLDRPEAEYAAEVATYRRRRDLLVKILGKAAKLELLVPDGAFYAFVGVGSYLRSGEDSIGFAERLLAEAKVAVVPGTPFGRPDHVRLSFATDDRQVQEGCERIVRFLGA